VATANLHIYHRETLRQRRPDCCQEGAKIHSQRYANCELNETCTGKYKIRAVVAALIVAAALPGCVLIRQSSSPPGAQKTTANVEKNFGKHAELEPPNLLNVQTIDRVVYLYGTVSTGLQREDAESVANEE
jgi:hypothetical protein